MLIPEMGDNGHYGKLGALHGRHPGGIGQDRGVLVQMCQIDGSENITAHAVASFSSRGAGPFLRAVRARWFRAIIPSSSSAGMKENSLGIRSASTSNVITEHQID